MVRDLRIAFPLLFSTVMIIGVCLFYNFLVQGLGDYIPGDSPSQPLRPLYKIATTGINLDAFIFLLKID